MNGDWRTKSPAQVFRQVTALVCAFLLFAGDANLAAQESTNTGQQQAAKLPSDQLDSLVAPIALYPDPLLSQTLVASTYPLEIVQLQQWLQQNKGLKDKALADAVMKQDWDPSIQAMAALPDVVKLLAENIKWTTDLGNAFLAQQNDVMDAVQRMRNKAKGTGSLQTTEQQKVETKVVENKTVVVIEQANPEVVYVPSYDPVVVYGAPVYAYPPIVYPAGYYAAGMALSFGVGLAMGAAWGGGWGYGCGWGGNNNVYINHNNNFVNNSNRQNYRGGNRNQVSHRGQSNWQHNPRHRGGAPYSDRATASRFGGAARGDSVANRQANARRQNASMNRGTAGTMDRGANRQAGSMNRSGTGGGGFGGGGGGDRVGNRSVPNTPSARDRSAFGGAGSGMSGSGARESRSRGASSMGGGRGGGGRGGGGRGGGRRR
jgi:hypothetical protein